jgi:hypothetical protein
MPSDTSEEAGRGGRLTDRQRDPQTGQYAYELEDFGRMCRCGHTLGVHVAGGFDCLNAETSIGPEHTGEPCDCQKFRPAKLRKPSGRAALTAGEKE